MCVIGKERRFFPLAHILVAQVDMGYREKDTHFSFSAHNSTRKCVIIEKGRRSFPLAHVPVAHVDVCYRKKDVYFLFSTHVSNTSRCVFSGKEKTFSL